MDVSISKMKNYVIRKTALHLFVLPYPHIRRLVLWDLEMVPGVVPREDHICNFSQHTLLMEYLISTDPTHISRKMSPPCLGKDVSWLLFRFEHFGTLCHVNKLNIAGEPEMRWSSDNLIARIERTSYWKFFLESESRR